MALLGNVENVDKIVVSPFSTSEIEKKRRNVSGSTLLFKTHPWPLLMLFEKVDVLRKPTLAFQGWYPLEDGA